MGLSPVETSPITFKQDLGPLIENIDAFPVIDPATGEIGLRRIPSSVPATGWR